MDNASLSMVHAKLLAFDFLTLTLARTSITSAPTFSRDGVPLTRAETLGVVVSFDHKPNRYLKFSVDDGTGCIPCVLWLNHATSPYFARLSPPDVRRIAQAATHQASLVKLGSLARVRGRITSYQGSVQIVVSSVAIERDPNAEILHWLDCLKLARRVYDRSSRCQSS